MPLPDFEQMLIERLKWSQKRFRRLSYVTTFGLIFAFVCTFYTVHHLNVEYMLGSLVLWLVFGGLHISFCSMSYRDGVHAARLEKGDYKRMIVECLAVHVSEDADSTFEVKNSEGCYLLSGPTYLAVGLVPVFDIPNHSPIYLIVADVDGWKRVICRHLVPYPHVLHRDF